MTPLGVSVCRCCAWVALGAVSVLSPDCVAGSQSAARLYDGSPQPRERIARVTGYVRFADGVDVSGRGGGFDVERKKDKRDAEAEASEVDTTC